MCNFHCIRQIRICENHKRTRRRPLGRRLVRHSPSLSNAERLEYEPATQLPQSGLVQWAISVAIGHYLDALETSSKTSVGSDILSSPRSSGPSLAERLSLLVLRGFIDRNRISEMSRR